MSWGTLNLHFSFSTQPSLLEKNRLNGAPFFRIIRVLVSSSFLDLLQALTSPHDRLAEGHQRTDLHFH